MQSKRILYFSNWLLEHSPFTLLNHVVYICLSSVFPFLKIKKNCDIRTARIFPQTQAKKKTEDVNSFQNNMYIQYVQFYLCIYVYTICRYIDIYIYK
jgi:hypothetical protein